MPTFKASFSNKNGNMSFSIAQAGAVLVKYISAKIKPNTLATLKTMLLTESLYLPVTKGDTAP